MFRLIVGLGNPGDEYLLTRHNLGFLVVDELAKRKGLRFKRERLFSGNLARGDGFILLKPETFMNLSGQSVGSLLRKEGIKIDELLVIHDEVALFFGDLRLKVGGGSGGHNGVKDIMALGSPEFVRLRAGVGPYDGSLERETLSEFVLSPFGEKEKQLLPDVVGRGAEIVEALLTQPLTQVILKYHSKPQTTNKENG
jgi:PTH1 family peptidyl-tRNA hydrolase